MGGRGGQGWEVITDQAANSDESKCTRGIHTKRLFSHSREVSSTKNSSDSFTFGCVSFNSIGGSLALVGVHTKGYLPSFIGKEWKEMYKNMWLSVGRVKNINMRL